MRIAVSRRRTSRLPSSFHPIYPLTSCLARPPHHLTPPNPPSYKAPCHVQSLSNTKRFMSLPFAPPKTRARLRRVFPRRFLFVLFFCFVFRRADGWHYERAITSSLCHSPLIQTPFDLKPGTAFRSRALPSHSDAGAGAQTICTRLSDIRLTDERFTRSPPNVCKDSPSSFRRGPFISRVSSEPDIRRRMPPHIAQANNNIAILNAFKKEGGWGGGERARMPHP